MIDFRPVTLEIKEKYESLLETCPERGCEYSFANLYLWGRQRMAFVEGFAVLFSQFSRKSVYPFPVGQGDLKKPLDAIIRDAAKRGIPCRLTAMTKEDCEKLEALYPGAFRFHTDRNSFDYIYNIDDLADLPGRRFQRKRNHVNRFMQMHPDYCLEPITAENTAQAEELVRQWYEDRLREDPTQDYRMEQAALSRALRCRRELGMEGLLLKVQGRAVAMTLGSRLSGETMDVHFEKALDRNDGAYGVINRGFARYLREKHPQLRFLNREDDMGLEGLRKAKSSYCPARMGEKYWACLLEEGYDY